MTDARVSRNAWILALAPCAILGLIFVVATQEAIPKSSYVAGTLWALLLFAAMNGWGAGLARLCVPGRAVDVGLRVAWGAAVLLFFGGILTMSSLHSRTMAMLLVDAGAALTAWDLVRRRFEHTPRLRLAWRAARKNRAIAALGAAAALMTVLHFLAAAGDDSSNPYDDDIAYFALVKRVIQTGSMIEPFSFRRISALGGQPFFLSLLYPRATFQQMNLFDRGICVVGVVLLIAGFRRDGRRAPPWVTLLAIAMFLGAPNISINTAGHFSGVLFFFALFRTLVLVSELPPALDHLTTARRAALPALLAAGACTLRQNFLAPAVITVFASEVYVALDRKGVAWRERLVRPACASAIAFVAILPWLVMSYRSSHTPLYPLILGTYNPALVLESHLFTWADELRLFIAVAVENEPIRTMALFVVAGVLFRERAATKPLRSLWIGTAVGYVVLTHTLSQGDAGNLSRYLFGFLTALALATLLTAGSTWHVRDASATLRAARFLAISAVCIQLVVTRDRLFRRYELLGAQAKAHLHDAVASVHTERTETFVYGNVQNAIPAGAPFAFMVDEPYYLDFARNPLFNIDMPGYASLPPGLPYFEGAEAKVSYWKSLGVHYLVFTTSDFSRAHYRRDFWFHRLFADEEIWRLYAPYQLDMIDDLATLRRTHKVLYEERGICAISLD